MQLFSLKYCAKINVTFSFSIFFYRWHVGWIFFSVWQLCTASRPDVGDDWVVCACVNTSHVTTRPSPPVVSYSDNRGQASQDFAGIVVYPLRRSPHFHSQWQYCFNVSVTNVRFNRPIHLGPLRDKIVTGRPAIEDCFVCLVWLWIHYC